MTCHCVEWKSGGRTVLNEQQDHALDVTGRLRPCELALEEAKLFVLLGFVEHHDLAATGHPTAYLPKWALMLSRTPSFWSSLDNALLLLEKADAEQRDAWAWQLGVLGEKWAAHYETKGTTYAPETARALVEALGRLP